MARIITTNLNEEFKNAKAGNPPNKGLGARLAKNPTGVTMGKTAIIEKDSLPKIFISYRKCDKKQLNRLITQIKAHSKSNEISIWYDQSLNPGENYSNTIIEQIKSCDLFLMLVTPNLLEPNNYVTRVEYPLAVKEKKRIVPIVMQKTDLNQLADSFPDIPKCITASQTDAIFSKIKN